MMKKMYLFFVVLIAALTAPAAGVGQSDPEIVKSKGEYPQAGR